MRILIFDAGSYTYRDFKNALNKTHHEVESIYYHFSDRYNDDFFSERIRRELSKQKYNVVFSINFFPLLAEACHEMEIPYISWVYDSPLDNKLLNYFSFATNQIYLFDREEVEKYKALGYGNVYHLPLAVNSDRLNRLSFSRETMDKYKSDIAFVGRLYTSDLDSLVGFADDYVSGYIEGLFQSQFRIYGYNFLEEAITDDLLDKLNESYAKLGQNNVKLNKRGLAYAISSQITHIERTVLINSLSEEYDVRVYSDESFGLDNRVKLCGPVNYYNEMNAVFRQCKINLNPTLRSISSGIPLRALDIMAAGGVLLSNYQLELAEVFEDGLDLIMYDSIEDAIQKVNYYISKPSELSMIAENGMKKTQECFSYDERIRYMLESL